MSSLLPDPKRQKPSADYSKITLRQCTSLLKTIKQMPEATPFLVPVDPVLLRIPDYPTIVKNPMDLGTIESKLTSASYTDVEAFVKDTRLVFANSYIYNKHDSPVGLATKKLEGAFEEKLTSLVNSCAGPAVARPAALAPVSVGGPGPALVSSIKPIIKSLLSHALSAPFRQPLDWEKAGFDTYPTIVKKPMDLSTVQRKLEESAYRNVAEVHCDLDLIWDNCILFNGRKTWIGDHCSQLREFATKKFAQAGLKDEQLLSYESGTPRGKLGAGKVAPAPEPPLGRKPPTKRYRAGQEPWAQPEAPTAEPSAPAVVTPDAAPSGGASDPGGAAPLLITMRQCKSLLTPIMKMPEARDFLAPVDWQRYNLVDYPTIITTPMDLGTIEKKLDTRMYTNADDFVADVKLVWANAIKYNGLESPYGTKATQLGKTFDAALHAMLNPAATTGARPPLVQPPGGTAQQLPSGANNQAEPSGAIAPKPVKQQLAPPLVPARAPSAPGSSTVLARPSLGLGNTREQLRSTYRRVIQSARTHQNGQIFAKPVAWEKLNLLQYPEVVKRPMDLSTIGKKLENCEYATFEEMQADFDLMFDNAILFNGEGSWVIKHVQALRAFLDKKCAAAAAAMQKHQSALASGGTTEGISARGNVQTVTVDDKMLTPQMRNHLYQNASVLQPPQLKKFRDLVRQLCPAAIEDLPSGEVKIDLEAFDFRSFIRIDTSVRLMSLSCPPPQAAGT